MPERLKYVSPEYQERLDTLAETLLRDRRVGSAALDDTVEMQLTFDELDNPNIIVGEE